MALDHKLARENLLVGLRRLLGVEPDLSVAQHLQAVGMLETGYGTGWKNAGAGSFNMGAVIAGASWTGPTFENRDSYPDNKGNNVWYTTKFRKYATAGDGWNDLANIVYGKRPTVLVAAREHDTFGFSEAMYKTGYYAGYGATPEERIKRHWTAMASSLKTITAALNEPMPGPMWLPDTLTPTIKRGARGEAVKTLQRLLNVGLVIDGAFGEATEKAVMAFQKKHDLPPNGIVSSLTWNTLGAKQT